MARRTFFSCTVQHYLVKLLRRMNQATVTISIDDNAYHFVLPAGWTLAVSAPVRAIVAPIPGATTNAWSVRGTAVGETTLIASHLASNLSVLLSFIVVA